MTLMDAADAFAKFAGGSALLGGFVLSVASFLKSNARDAKIAEMTRLSLINHNLLNGMSERKDQAIASANRAEGQEEGRQQERADPQQPRPQRP